MNSSHEQPNPIFSFLVAELRESSAFTTSQLFERVAGKMRQAGLHYSEAQSLDVYAYLQYLVQQQGVIKESRLERGVRGRTFYYSGTDKLRASTIPPPQDDDEDVVSPPPLPPPPTTASHSPEEFWDEAGMGRLIPIYLQLHLASRSPQHTLARRPDGSIDTDDVPALTMFYDENPRRQEQIRADFVRLMSEQLPNDPSTLSALTTDHIVSRLSHIYTQVTGKDMYGIVSRKWCAERRLLC